MEAPRTKRRKLQCFFFYFSERAFVRFSRAHGKKSTATQSIFYSVSTNTIRDIKFYLHCTSSVATLEEVFPTLLVASQLYSPLSFLLTFAIVNSLLFDVKLILLFTLVFTADPPMVHENAVGSGFPVALQVKVTLLPSVFCRLGGGVGNSGISEIRKR